MTRLAASLAIAGTTVLIPALAHAHIAVASGLGVANTTQEVTFSVGHGCSGADTVAVSIEIPTGVSSVRPETSDFGQVDVQTDDAGAVTLVSWRKSSAPLQADTQFYKLSLRLKVSDVPFSRLYFPAHQSCRAAEGTATTVVDWVGIDEPDGSLVEPAPALFVVPARFPGWNQFTVAAAVPELSAFFPDAQIVWKGSLAYSINPATVSLIQGTDGVSLLHALSPGDSIWVKY